LLLEIEGRIGKIVEDEPNAKPKFIGKLPNGNSPKGGALPSGKPPKHERLRLPEKRMQL